MKISCFSGSGVEVAVVKKTKTFKQAKGLPLPEMLHRVLCQIVIFPILISFFLNKEMEKIQ